MNLGDTYIIEGHLWIVVSDPVADGSVAMVNLTSHKPPCDETCILNPGDHPFVRHKTIVKYCWATMVTPQKQVEVTRRFPARAPVGGALLAKIQRGALTSEATKPKIATAIEATLKKTKP